jgi:hypothetical protein
MYVIRENCFSIMDKTVLALASCWKLQPPYFKDEQKFKCWHKTTATKPFG